MKTNIVFRVNASSKIGMGHYSRCFSLASILKNNEFNTFLITNNSNEHNSKRFPAIEVKVVDDLEIATSKDSNLIKSYSEKVNADFIVIDGYDYDKEFESDILNPKWKVVCIDDVPSREYVSDILINQNYGAEKLNFRTGPETILALGLNYLTISDKFKEQASEGTSCVKYKSDILITLGNTDLNTTHFECIRQLCGEFKDLKIILITSNQFPEKPPQNLNVIKPVNEIQKYMSSTRLAIVSAGRSMWELIYLNVPFISIPLNAIQEEYIEKISKDSICKHFKQVASIKSSEFYHEVDLLLNNNQIKEEKNKLFESLMDRESLDKNILALFTK